VDVKALLELVSPLTDLLGDHPAARAVAVFVIAAIAAGVLAYAIARFARLLTQRTSSRLDDDVVHALRVPLVWSVLVIGAVAALATLQLSDRWMRIAGDAATTVLVVLWSIAIFRLFRLFLNALSARAGAASIVRPQTLPLFNNVSLVLVLAVATYLIFLTWQIDMTAWIASAGIAGIAIGFAAKDTLANLFAGVFILADGPYKIGDYVVLESGERGKVTNIGIRSTRILTRDDVEVTIPNSIMGNTRIVNESGGPHEKYRIRVQVGVAYGSDVDQVRAVLIDIADGNEEICRDPEPRVRFRAFGGSSLDFELLCWVDHPELRGRALDALNTAVYKRFRDEGIEIPYSKQDVYIKEMPRR